MNKRSLPHTHIYEVKPDDFTGLEAKNTQQVGPDTK